MKTKNRISNFFKYLILIVLSVISIFPFYFMIVGMTNKTIDINTGKLTFGGNLMTNLHSLFGSELDFPRALLNSAIIAIAVTLLSLALSSLAGYGFEIYRTKTTENVFNILLLSMMVPFAALMIPLYRMFSKLSNTPFQVVGINTFYAVIIPTMTTAFLIFFFRQNVKSFPIDLIEAARLDGLNEFRIFTRIYVPASKNTYSAAAIITFMSAWNNYLWPLVVLQSPDKRTIPLVLSAMGASYTPDYGMMMCGIVISTLPIAILFFFMQKNFVQGMLGSVKG
ncbi:carbohydrate ABC transporter permease [Lapidilactobacillus luobeiensis]|uniref:carbohydrate ABC transporter permease n=1 Tax=Lapidilactobacillus luobeiensis TaxID=2950371 RepID=UPI0021C493A0|nr:carbohydrate ABC transporter permease [Lapidilactobacillus luobeiensis]